MDRSGQGPDPASLLATLAVSSYLGDLGKLLTSRKRAVGDEGLHLHGGWGSRWYCGEEACGVPGRGWAHGAHLISGVFLPDIISSSFVHTKNAFVIRELTSSTPSSGPPGIYEVPPLTESACWTSRQRKDALSDLNSRPAGDSDRD